MLRTALRANAVFSGLSAISFLLAAPFLSQVLFSSQGSEALPLSAELTLRSVGVGLAMFSAYCLWASLSPENAQRETPAIVVADFGWVIASAILLAFAHGAFTLIGLLGVTGIAAIVGSLALWQWVGLRRPRSSPAEFKSS